METEKCTLTSTYFDTNDVIIVAATTIAKKEESTCCQKSFDESLDDDERAVLMMACDKTQQEYKWDAESSVCTLTAVSAFDPEDSTTDERYAEECCRSGFNFDYDDSAKRAELLRACDQMYAWTQEDVTCQLISISN